jgi:hypothetical protein
MSIVVWMCDGIEYKTDPMPVLEARLLYVKRRDALSTLERERIELRPFCEVCNERPMDHETSDHKSLCATCAQDTHLPCGGCGDIAPAIEVDVVSGTCLACRVSDAEEYDKGNIETRRALFEAERLLLLIIEKEPELNWLGSLNPGLALSGVRKAHHPG